ncbi:MAG: hypothetical protein DMG08_22130, partial [Acidobacteria bacterium]
MDRRITAEKRRGGGAEEILPLCPSAPQPLRSILSAQNSAPSGMDGLPFGGLGRRGNDFVEGVMQPGNPLLHPQMLACQNFLRDLVRRVIIVVEDGVETRFDPGARQAAKVIGEPHRFAPVLAFLQQHLGADASGAHRKE